MRDILGSILCSFSSLYYLYHFTHQVILRHFFTIHSYLRFLPSNSSYRSRDEIQSVRKTQDPIAGLKERLLGADLATDEDIKVGERIRTQG